MEGILIILVSSAFFFTMVAMAVGVFLSWSLVQAVRKVDPLKYRELRTPTSIWNRTSWVNPRKLGAFVKAGDSLGSEAVAKRLRAYRTTLRVVRLGAVLYFVSLALFLTIWQ